MFCPKCREALKRDEKSSTNIIRYDCPGCGTKYREDQSGSLGQKTNLKELGTNDMPPCPNCGRNENVIKNSDQSTMFQMFIAKPIDEYFCGTCNKGFSLPR